MADYYDDNAAAPGRRNGWTPQIKIRGSSFLSAQDSIIDALSHAPNIFISPDDSPVLLEVKDGTVTRVKAHDMIRYSGSIYRLVKEKKAKDNVILEPLDLPLAAAAALLTAPLLGRGFRPLSVVSDRPVLLKSGDIVYRPGYTMVEGEGVEIVKSGVDWDSLIKPSPTYEDALAAIDFLWEFIKEFNFVADVDRSVASAVFLTAAIWKSAPWLRPAPFFGFSATQKGTGKSLLASVVASPIMSFSQEKPLIIAHGFSDEEFMKRYAGAAIKGQEAVIVDNVIRRLNGGDLAIKATEKRSSDRELGFTINHVTRQMLTVVTGNNLTVDEDMHRRTLRSRQEALQRLDSRVFSRSPTELMLEAQKLRPEIVAAALTIASATIRLAPPLQNQMSSFEDWSAVVPRALVWLGRENPLLALKVHASDDEESSRFRAFVLSAADWFARKGGKHFAGGFSAHDLATTAMAMDGDNAPIETDLYQACATVAPSSSFFGRFARVDATKLGYFLRGIAGKPHVTDSGRLIRIVSAGRDASSSRRVALYSVEIDGNHVTPGSPPPATNVFKAPPPNHICEICGDPASSGRGAPGSPHGVVRWFCREHIDSWKLTPLRDSPATSPSAPDLSLTPSESGNEDDDEEYEWESADDDSGE